MVVSQAALNSVTTFYTCLVFREDEHLSRTLYKNHSVLLLELFRGLLLKTGVLLKTKKPPHPR